MKLLQRVQTKLIREGRYSFRDMTHWLGLYKQFYRTARGSRILIYHGICKNDHTRFNPIFLKLKNFESHLKFYKKHFNLVSLEDYYEQKFSTDRFNVCLTFDDGFANNYKYVLPLLNKYQAPATFFITAIRAEGHDILWNDFLGIVSKYGPQHLDYKEEQYYKDRFGKYVSTATGLSLSEKLRGGDFAEKAEMMNTLYPLVPFKTSGRDVDYWLQMSKEQIQELAASPFARIGAHGYYHNDLAKINILNAGKELSLSKHFLENIIGQPVKSFAFPYGSYTSDVVAAAKKAGYSHLLAMDFLHKEDQEDPSMRERLTVNPFISTNNQMYATVTGRYK